MNWVTMLVWEAAQESKAITKASGGKESSSPNSLMRKPTKTGSVSSKKFDEKIDLTKIPKDGFMEQVGEIFGKDFGITKMTMDELKATGGWES